MEPTIVAPPDAVLPNVNLPNIGDPLAKIGPPSNGMGAGGGIGRAGARHRHVRAAVPEVSRALKRMNL